MTNEGRSGSRRAAPSSSGYSAVVFDYDGVLADSLDPHLDFLRSMSAELGIEPKVPVPDAREFKARWVDTEDPHTMPLEDFIRAAGFMEAADALFGRYVEVFGDTPVPLFPGAERMLRDLRAREIRLGMVTANHSAVVRQQLGELIDLFEPTWYYAADTGPGAGKAWALEKILSDARLQPAELLFVGDQWSDAIAARDAGVDFLAVSYGWGLDESHAAHPVAHAPQEIGTYVLDAQG